MIVMFKAEGSMKQLKDYNRVFGLIGYPLSHSFSKKYFSQKFEQEDILDAFYELFPIAEIEAFPALLNDNPNLRGLNVTIPYKQAVLPYLDELSEGAAAVGAVNTIRVAKGKLKGFNTDVIGFKSSLQNWLNEERGNRKELRALILGTGGAAKAVAYVLNSMEIPFQWVSRNSGAERLSYQEITNEVIAAHQLVINTTPLGMSPNYSEKPELPYHAITEDHFLYDLVYNPDITAFMQAGIDQGAKVKNGLEMLHGQAEAAWSIWNEEEGEK